MFFDLAPIRAPLRRVFRAVSSAETELLRRARAGEREAITALFNRHRDRIFRFAFQILRENDAAEDAAQEILLRAFSKMPGFHGESEFSTWLYRLALNYCLDKKRIAERRAARLETQIEIETPPENIAQRVETRLAIEQALDMLPETLRVTLILRQWHELSYGEIAAILNVPAGTVRSRLHEARRQFRLIWEAQNAG